MALSSTVHAFEITLSDVDRNVYEQLDLRVAQHPSETLRRLLLRTLAYALSYEDGIAFSRGGLSSTDEPPLSIHDATGQLRRWIDVGAPSPERLHKASKMADVSVYTSELAQLRRQIEGKTVHRVDAIDIWPIDAAFLDGVVIHLDRRTKLDVTRTDGVLYVATNEVTSETPLIRSSLVDP